MRSLLLAAALLVGGAPAQARPVELSSALPQAERIGAGAYQVLGLAIFDAALWAENGAFAWDAPFALEITYRRGFSAAALTNRSITEMARRNSAARADARLRAMLMACFADVTPGDRISAVSTNEDSARFYINGAQSCSIVWPGFRRAFFGIWLDEAGPSRPLARQLLGRAS